MAGYSAKPADGLRLSGGWQQWEVGR
jgi:hypothetical protein